MNQSGAGSHPAALGFIVESENLGSYLLYFITFHGTLIGSSFTFTSFFPVLGIRIGKIRMFLGLPDLDPLVRVTDPDLA
jgi:hypothetical protein